jgi:DNA-binding NarL/FixJ family response regulator
MQPLPDSILYIAEQPNEPLMQFLRNSFSLFTHPFFGDTPTYPATKWALVDWHNEATTAYQHIRDLRQQQPACLSLLAIRPEALPQAWGVNASSYIDVPVKSSTLMESIATLRRGERYLSAVEADMLSQYKTVKSAKPRIQLTAREKELSHLLAKGLTHQQLIDQMFLSDSRIKHIKTELAQKLNLPSARHLTAWAIQFTGEA